MSGGYAVASTATIPRIRASNKIKPSRKLRKEKVKLSIKQRIRNWLFDEEGSAEVNYEPIRDVPSLDSEGMRFTVFKASGGFVIETRTYDRRRDENTTSMYVITEDKVLGDELGKIITMESLR